MGKTWFQVISEEIEKRIADIQHALGSGSAKDFTAYREACGQIQGLRATQIYIQDIARNYMELEND